MTAFLIILFTIIALLFLWCLLLRPVKKPKDTPSVLRCHYAHRGLHGGQVPENSLLAFRRAVEAGYGIELDVQLSADGEVMVFHDYTLDRMTGREGKLSDWPADELSEQKLKTAAGEMTEETIPTLKQVLEVVDGRVPLLVELKGESTDTSLCPAVDHILREYAGPYCIESFNPMLLAWYKKNQPKVYRGLLYTNVWKEKKRTLLNGILSLMLLNPLASPHFIAYDRKYPRAAAVGCAVRLWKADSFTWTIRREEEARGITTYMIFENVRP